MKRDRPEVCDAVSLDAVEHLLKVELFHHHQCRLRDARRCSVRYQNQSAAAYPDEQVEVEHDDQTVDICNERPSDVAPEITIENLR